MADLPASDVAPGGRPARGRVVEIHSSEGERVCDRCVIADTVRLRLRGLLGRHELPAGEGLWIQPTNSIHMFFMRFAIDAVFMDGDGVIVRVVPRLRPGRMAACRRARSVLEIAEGEAERLRLRPGLRLASKEHGELAAAA